MLAFQALKMKFRKIEFLVSQLRYLERELNFRIHTKKRRVFRAERGLGARLFQSKA
jgi:hypothetical protein